MQTIAQYREVADFRSPGHSEPIQNFVDVAGTIQKSLLRGD